MPHSLARLHVHLIFSTKNRAPLLRDKVRDALHRYLAVVLENCGCAVNLINSVEDDVHILFELSRTAAISTVVEGIKTSSSKWIKTQGSEFAGFAWQAGYGAFSVSESGVAVVREYIAGQREHHKKSLSRMNTGAFSRCIISRSRSGTSGSNAAQPPKPRTQGVALGWRSAAPLGLANPRTARAGSAQPAPCFPNPVR